MTLPQRIWAIVEMHESQEAYWFDKFIVTLISLNLIAFVLETDPDLAAEFGSWFRTFDSISIGIFTVELAARLYACPSEQRFSCRFGRLRYLFSLHGMVDLLAILPFYLQLIFSFFAFDARFLRILRILQFLKGFHYSRSLQRLTQIFAGKSEELLSSLIVMLSLLFVTSTLMYYAEHEAQPDKFGSIVESMWWAVATLTTVGYGDVTPITTLGRFLGAASAIIGIGLFAIPTGILAAGFAESHEPLESSKIQEKITHKVCEHCGQRISRNYSRNQS